LINYHISYHLLIIFVMQTYENDNKTSESDIFLSLNQLKVDIKEYITTIDISTNIETQLFMKIKGCYKLLITSFIDYITDEDNIPNYQFMSTIKSELNNINKIIDNYDNIIKGRTFEFKHRISQLVNNLNQSNMSNTTINLVRAINIYNELTF